MDQRLEDIDLMVLEIRNMAEDLEGTDKLPEIAALCRDIRHKVIEVESIAQELMAEEVKHED